MAHATCQRSSASVRFVTLRCFLLSQIEKDSKATHYDLTPPLDKVENHLRAASTNRVFLHKLGLSDVQVALESAHTV